MCLTPFFRRLFAWRSDRGAGGNLDHDAFALDSVVVSEDSSVDSDEGSSVDLSDYPLGTRIASREAVMEYYSSGKSINHYPKGYVHDPCRIRVSEQFKTSAGAQITKLNVEGEEAPVYVRNDSLRSRFKRHNGDNQASGVGHSEEETSPLIQQDELNQAIAIYGQAHQDRGFIPFDIDDTETMTKASSVTSTTQGSKRIYNWLDVAKKKEE